MQLIKIVLGLVVLSSCGPESSVGTASKKYNRYLAHLFNKYGTGGTMSFEGLEHLMYNLGLGGLEFSPKHTIEEHHPNGYKIPEFTLDDNDIGDADDEEEVIAGIDHGQIIRVTHVHDHNHTKQQNPVENNSTSDNSSKGAELKNIPEENVNPDLQDDSSILFLDDDDNNKSTFKEMHDPKHRHPRHRDEHSLPTTSRCLSPLSLMKLVIDPDHNQLEVQKPVEPQRSKRHTPKATTLPVAGIENEEDIIYTSTKITPTTFMKICPALLVQIDQDACAQIVEDEGPERRQEAYYISWIYASVSIFIISCCGLFGVAIVPLTRCNSYNEVLKFLIAIAIGTLCGDAFMHLLPHALTPGHGSRHSPNSHSDHNEPVFLCGCAFLTAVFMYALETSLSSIKGADGHNHGHSHQTFKPKDEGKHVDINMEHVNPENKQKELNTMLNENKLDEKENPALSPVAFMVILGDGLHNLTDGLAIGAAFASEPVTGMATAFAVLCHELPHELGDFALLIKTGVHINRAIYLNIVSSILSFIGMAAGLVLAEMQAEAVRWIYAGTAGSFLYIALTDLIPEMGRDGKNDLKNCFIQTFGIALGGLIMLVIALYEDHLRTLFE